MGQDDEIWLRRARTILAEVTSSTAPLPPRAEHGFAIETIGGRQLLSRRGHAIGVLQQDGDELQFTRAGYAEPTFRTRSSEHMSAHLVEVIASVLRPFDPRA